MDVVLVPVAEDDKVVLARLLELYRYDMSDFRPYTLSPHGTFGYRFLDAYFDGGDRLAYFVRVDGELAGFAMARLLDTGTGEREVAEFFVMRRYRGRGVGRAVARDLFTKHPGRWLVAFDDANEHGAAFWAGICGEMGTVTRTRKPADAVYPGEELRFTIG